MNTIANVDITTATTIYIMCGLPGAGKSTFVKKKTNTPVVCLDTIRKELYGSESIQGDGKKVFEIGMDRLKKLAKKGSVIYDATNISPWARKNVLNNLKEFQSKKVCVYIDTELEECLKRNSIRERHVPEEVIKGMAAKFIVPTKEEGFDEIITPNHPQKFKIEKTSLIQRSNPYQFYEDYGIDDDGTMETTTIFVGTEEECQTKIKNIYSFFLGKGITLNYNQNKLSFWEGDYFTQYQIEKAKNNDKIAQDWELEDFEK